MRGLHSGRDVAGESIVGGTFRRECHDGDSLVYEYDRLAFENPTRVGDDYVFDEGTIPDTVAVGDLFRWDQIPRGHRAIEQHHWVLGPVETLYAVPRGVGAGGEIVTLDAAAHDSTAVETWPGISVAVRLQTPGDITFALSELRTVSDPPAIYEEVAATYEDTIGISVTEPVEGPPYTPKYDTLSLEMDGVSVTVEEESARR